MDIETQLWRLTAVNTAYVMVLQKASGVQRMVSRGLFPSDYDLAMMHELRFNRLCREAFHGEASGNA